MALRLPDWRLLGDGSLFGSFSKIRKRGAMLGRHAQTMPRLVSIISQIPRGTKDPVVVLVMKCSCATEEKPTGYISVSMSLEYGHQAHRGNNNHTMIPDKPHTESAHISRLDLQSSKYEYYRSRNFLRGWKLKIPNQWHRKYKQEQVRKNVWNRDSQIILDCIDANWFRRCTPKT